MRHFSTTLLTLAASASGLAVMAIMENDSIVAFLRQTGPWIAAMAVALLAAIGMTLWAGYRLIKRWLHRRGLLDRDLSDTEMVEALVDQFTGSDGFEHPTPEHRQRAAMVSLGLFLARRGASQLYFQITVAVIAFFGGAASIFLLYEQNNRIRLQTDANIAESVLLEGVRRATMAPALNQLTLDVEESANPKEVDSKPCPSELGGSDCWSAANGGVYFLPIAQRGRVQAFLKHSTPYRIAIPLTANLDFERPLREQYRFQNTSPERGQLLQVFARNRVSVLGYEFAAAQLTGVDLARSHLKGGKLNGADMTDADLRESTLDRAHLRGAHLAGAYMARASLVGTRLSDADMRRSTMNGANLRLANLAQADLSGAGLLNASFYKAQLSGTNFSGAVLDLVKWNDSWAWRDQPPIGLPPSAEIILCDFDPEIHDRDEPPLDCAGIMEPPTVE